MKFFNGNDLQYYGHRGNRTNKKRGFSLIYVSTAFNSLRKHSDTSRKPKSASISHDIFPAELKKRITDPELLFKREYLVGKGTFGHVYKVTDRRTGAPLAAKIIDLEKSTQDLEDVQQEIIVLSQCNSPYIIEYFASYVKNHSLWIMMEYVDGTSAKQLAKSGLLHEKHIGVIIRETLKGLDYLHTNALKIHRDIKAANILISLNGEVKLADFGVAGQLSESVTKRASLVGSPFWMAPEIIKDSKYTFKADIWSLGICAIELAAQGSPPYVHLHPMKAMISIAEDPSPCLESTLALISNSGAQDADKFTSKFKCFIDLCLNKEPDQRPTAKQLLQHQFIKRTKNNSILAKLVKKRKMKFSAHADTLNDTDDDDSSCTDDDQEDDALIENVMNNFESLFIESHNRNSCCETLWDEEPSPAVPNEGKLANYFTSQCSLRSIDSVDSFLETNFYSILHNNSNLARESVSVDAEFHKRPAHRGAKISLTDKSGGCGEQGGPTTLERRKNGFSIARDLFHPFVRQKLKLSKQNHIKTMKQTTSPMENLSNFRRKPQYEAIIDDLFTEIVKNMKNNSGRTVVKDH